MNIITKIVKELISKNHNDQLRILIILIIMIHQWGLENKQ